MRGTWTLAMCALCVLVGLVGCGGTRLDVGPAVESTDKEYVDVTNVSLVQEGRRQYVEIRLSVWKDFPSPLVYDVIARGEKLVQQNVPTNISGAEAGSRTLKIPAESAFAGGKILFHLLEHPASAPASAPSG